MDPLSFGHPAIAVAIVAVVQAPSLDEALHAGEALITEARGAYDAQDVVSAEALLVEALGLVVAEPGAAENATALQFVERLGEAANDVRALRVARDARAWVLARREALLDENDPDLQWARQYLAIAKYQLGDLVGARELLELVVETSERTLDEGHDDLTAARANLASILFQSGEYEAARALQEHVLAVREDVYADEDERLQSVRHNLAATMNRMGDLRGSRALMEKVLAIYEGTRPENDPDLQRARKNLAITREQMGDLPGARDLIEHVLAVQQGILGEEHRDVQRTRLNLSGVLARMGQLDDARQMQEAVRAHYLEILPADHPHLQRARGLLAFTLAEEGEREEAILLRRKSLEVLERTHPREHPDLLRERFNLASLLAAAGEQDSLSAELESLADSIEAWLLASLLLSPRDARARSESVGPSLSYLLSLVPLLEEDGGLATRAFELVETARSVVSGGVSAAAAADSEVVALRERALGQRERVNDLVLGLGEVVGERPTWDAVQAAIFERDRVEAELARRLVAAGYVDPAIEVPVLAAALPEGSVAVGYDRYTRIAPGTATWHLTRGEQVLLAHVVHADGTLVRLELGSIEEIEALIERWREALGKPLLARGVAATIAAQPSEPPAGERAAGEALRRRVLDPVLAAAGDASAIYVCLDDVLHLAPLDGLPLDTGRVGDAEHLHVLPSFSRLVRPLPALDSEPTLLALGGIDFGGREEESAGPDESRSPVGIEFRELPETGPEVRTLAELYEQTFDREPHVLTSGGASKHALRAEAPRARYLHLATHGYFASERLSSSAELADRAASWSGTTLEASVRGLAPMVLCGLALADANAARDSRGRVSGILTAEELAGMSLAGCELAVLSACETNVGIRRAGAGLQSLQSALHAAGVRSAVTSLWKVDDRWTRLLMEDFYRRLWVLGEPKSQALWNAKKTLSGAGAQVRDWAGWVLTGDPD